MLSLGRAISDSVSLCRLVTCVPMVSQNKTSCMPLSPVSSVIRDFVEDLTLKLHN
jgi:hypothetical protein